MTPLDAPVFELHRRELKRVGVQASRAADASFTAQLPHHEEPFVASYLGFERIRRRKSSGRDAAA